MISTPHERFNADNVVIGGGILGLMTAWKLVLSKPSETTVLIEQEQFLGEHSTGRNSGVLHAGIYYEYGSLKHRHCLNGLTQWKQIVEKLKISHKICGKFIFASASGEEEQLDNILTRAKKNGVRGIRYIPNNELQTLNTFVVARKALFSPETGILDAAEAVTTLRTAVEQAGGIILTQAKVIKIDPELDSFLISTPRELIFTRRIFNCAGLEACSIRALLGLTDLSPVYVKGNYLKTSQKLNHKHLLYPVPQNNLKGLGVHSTIDMQGTIKFGPNTEDVDKISYEVGDTQVPLMKSEVSKLFRNIDTNKLSADYCGIRSKIKYSKNGVLFTDFWIRDGAEDNIPGYVEACGIESPGLTASPSIADQLIESAYK